MQPKKYTPVKRLALLTATLTALIVSAGACRNRGQGAALQNQGDDQPLLPRSSFNFAAVRALIATANPQTVEQLLALFPADFRSRPLFLSDSRSTQEAHALAPRVILTNEDMSFFVAFNGEPSQAGYRDLETAEFDQQTGRYTFREIEFPDQDAPGPAKISVDNPKVCAPCHKTPMRPLWEPWPVWPEAYFGKDHSADGSVVATDELNSFQAFLSGPATQGRYRLLSGYERYKEPAMLQQGEPARTFNQRILDQIAVMVTQEILRHPAYPRLQWAFAAAVQGCSDIEQYVPEAERSTFTQTFAAVNADTKLKNRSSGPRVAALRYLFENYRLATQHWSPSLRTRWAFRRGAGSVDDLDVVQEFSMRSGMGPLPSCEVLKARALSQL